MAKPKQSPKKEKRTVKAVWRQKPRGLSYDASSSEIAKRIGKILETVVPAPLHSKVINDKNIDKFFKLFWPYQYRILQLGHMLARIKSWGRYSFILGYLTGFFVFCIPRVLDNVYKFQGEWTVPFIAGGLFLVFWVPYVILDHYLWKKALQS